ncbi:MAG: hypothetical protein ACOH2M_05305 [Cypionkella sp.]
MGDLADILAGLNVSSGVAAIIGAGALVAAMLFASWLVDTVASFFDDADEEEFEAGVANYDWNCDFCGELRESWDYCGDVGGEMMCGACSRDDSRFT